MKYFYKIAGLIVSMESFGRTVEQAKPYLWNDVPKADIEIVSQWEKNKWKHPSMDDDSGEYMATGCDFNRKILMFQGFMLHSSAVVVDGRAYLFSADSGTGKSTHTALWLRQFGDRAYILNDDKPVLRLIDGTWYAFGTPWSGKHDISVNTGVPLAGIAILERSDENSIEPYTGKEAIFDVFRQTNRPKAMEYRVQLLELLDQLIRNVPVWKLRCNMQPEAAIVSYEAMSGKSVKSENK